MDTTQPNAESLSLSHPALYEQVAERLRNRIFSQELAPGTWIDEKALADDYGISRTPMREALKVLASEGLVQLKPRRGCYVTELTEQDLNDIFPVVALLEGRAAYEAALKASDVDLARLDAIHRRMKQLAGQADLNAFFKANLDFHLALQRIANNRWLMTAIDDLNKIMRLIRRDSMRLETRAPDSIAEHEAVLEAIRKRNPNDASRRMHDHMLNSRMSIA